MPPTIVLPQEYEGTVIATSPLTPKVVWLRAETAAPLSYTAGQYASFLINVHRRPLSYASPAADRTIEFIVDVTPGGVASTYVAQLKEGDRFRFLSPYGRFIVAAASPRPLLFIATGSGIAPIRAQILEQLATAEPRPMTLFFGNKDEEHMFLQDEFTRLADAHRHFTFIPMLSEPSAAWTGERGLVTQVVPRRIADVPAYDVYICGNPDMVKDVKAVLEQAGVPRAQMHTEQFT